VRGVEVDTAYFTGNYAPEVSVDGCHETADDADMEVCSAAYNAWHEVLGVRECGPSRRHAWTVRGRASEKAVTHVRLRMYPDGGIARFRLYGTVVPVWPVDQSQPIELSATGMGGLAVSWSDQHFGSPSNLLLPGRGKDMGDGWETKRSRGEHVDWAVIQLGARGFVHRLVVDTAFFRGNFPRAVQVEALDIGEMDGTAKVPDDGDKRWRLFLPETKMAADKEFEFKEEVASNKSEAVTHLRLIMIPDGGVKRLRAFGMRALQTSASKEAC